MCDMSRISKIIRNDSDLWVQSNLSLGQSIVLLSLQAPICQHICFSMFIVRPETRVHTNSSYQVVDLPFRK